MQLWMTELDRRFYQVMVTQQEAMLQETVQQEEFDKLSWVMGGITLRAINPTMRQLVAAPFRMASCG